MTQRQSAMAKSIFYRGISLKEYLRKSKEIYKELQIKEEQTIFLDQNQRPIPISDSFIQRQRTQNPSPHRLYQTNPTSSYQIHLPQITPKKSSNNKKNSLVSERNSTDVSLPLCVDAKSDQLVISKQNINARQHMKCQPSQSRCSNSRDAPFFLLDESCVFKESRPQLCSPRKLNRRNAQLQKQIQIKQRYNIIGRSLIRSHNKVAYRGRVKSQVK